MELLQDPFVLLALVGVVLFCAIALTALMVYRLLTQRRPAPPPLPPVEKPPAPTAPRLTEDPQLLAFMARGDPNFAREFPSLAGSRRQAAPPQPARDAGAPVVIRERVQPQLIRDGGVPQPASVKADPAVIGGPPAPALETPARPSPQPAMAAADADLAALMALWANLPARDRHELVQLARLKLGLPTEPGRGL